MREIAVALPPPDARARYALDVLASLLGVRARDAHGGARAELAYGDLKGAVVIPAGPQRGWDDEVPRVARHDGLPVLHLGSWAPTEGPVPFDLLYATYACLAAPWELTDPADEVGCPLARGGFLDRHGLLREPLVHSYARLLGRSLGFPLRGEPRIVLTHDVDDNFAHVFGRRVSLELLRRDLAARKPAAVRRLAGLARRVVRSRAPDPNDRFEDWRTWHADWSSRPAYFFATTGVLSPGSARHDVPYAISHPVVRETIRRAAECGAEIGVHFSIGARESASRMRSERRALETLVGAPVRTSRHHWWALGRPPQPTWRAQAEAGVALDCSLGFNDAPGFRRGICVPFRPFDPDSERPMNVWALPTIAMDAALPPDQVTEELRSFAGVVEEARGALVLDWHVHSANPEALPGAGEGLRRFLGETTLQLRTPLELLAERV